MPSTGLSNLVSGAFVAGVGGAVILFLLFALWKQGTRLGPMKARLSDDVLGGLLFAFVGLLMIVVGAGHYLLQANTGAYGTPDDFRNGAMFVDICWFAIVVVAPVVSILGFALLGSVAFRGWRTRRLRQQSRPVSSEGPDAITAGPRRAGRRRPG
jgi:hypothetical protein